MESSRDTERAAALWLAKRAGDRWSDADEAALNQWLEASTRNRVAFIRANTAWQQAARLKALGAGMSPGAIPAPGEWRFSPFFSSGPTVDVAAVEMGAQPETRWWWRVRFRALAAGVALVAAASVAWVHWPAGPSYRTPVGGLASVPIADGSKVTLNTDSEIRVTLTPTERRVNIEHGEAFFEVAKDSARPFVVRAGDKRIVAIGTKFSVRRDADDVRVVVTEGQVRVEGGSAETTPPTQLSAGTVARASATGVLVQAKPLPEVEEYLSWRSGYLVFRNVALADAVAEFNRYNTHRIVIDDPAVAVMRVGGNFRSTNVGGFLRLLQEGYPVRIEQRDEVTLLIAMDGED